MNKEDPENMTDMRSGDFKDLIRNKENLLSVFTLKGIC